MVRFYDPVDERDLARVEEILKRGGIEYFLHKEPAEEIGPHQVHVAEEDIPTAEALLMQEETQH
jgi:hypothetical protein